MNKTNELLEAPHLEEEQITTEKMFSGMLLHVFRDQVRLPDGGEGVREWIKHPGASAVIPVFEDGSVLMVRQYRYAAGKVFIEIPAGKRDSTEEPPLDVAHREMEEETGWTAGEMTYLGGLYPAIGFSDEIIHFYLGQHLQKGQQGTEDDEFVDVMRLDKPAIMRLLEDGVFMDMKTACGLRMAFEYLKKQEET